MLRNIRTLVEAKDALLNGTWDIVFYSQYLGNWHTPYELKETLLEAWKKKTFKLLILTNGTQSEGKELGKALKEAGVALRYFPFQYCPDPTIPAKLELKEF